MKLVLGILEVLLVILQIIVCVPLLLVIALISVALILGVITFCLVLLIISAPFVFVGMGYGYIKERIKGRR